LTTAPRRSPSPSATRPALPAAVPAAAPCPRAATRPSALRTLNVDTPAAAAIWLSLAPAASSSRIRAASCGVSLEAPFGSRRAGHPARAKRLIPPPHRDRIHPERRRGLRLADRAQPDQLHRRQPPPRLIPGIPGKGGQPVHRHQPAAIIHPIPPDPVTALIISGTGPPRPPLRRKTREKPAVSPGQDRGRDPITPRQQAAMSGVLVSRSCRVPVGVAEAPDWAGRPTRGTPGTATFRILMTTFRVAQRHRAPARLW